MGSLYYLHHLRSCAVATSGSRFPQQSCSGGSTGSNDYSGGDGGGGWGDPIGALFWVGIFATMTGAALADAIRGAPPLPPAVSVKRSAEVREFVQWRCKARGRATDELGDGDHGHGREDTHPEQGIDWVSPSASTVAAAVVVGTGRAPGA